MNKYIQVRLVEDFDTREEYDLAWSEDDVTHFNAQFGEAYDFYILKIEDGMVLEAWGGYRIPHLSETIYEVELYE